MITLFDHEQIMKAFEHDKFEEGRAEGREEGREEGWAEGKQKRSIEIAEDLLQKALPVDMIAEACRLSRSEVEALKAQLSL